MKKIIITFCMCILVFPSFVEAKTLQDLYNQLANLQSEYNANKNNKTLTEKEINTANTEISNINSNITQIREDIKKAEADITESNKEINNKKIETDGLLQFLQVSNGGNIYLEYIFDAENYTDFIYRYEVVKQLTNYNSDLIDELEVLIKDLEQKEIQLENKQQELEKKRKELTTKVNTLSASLASYQTEGATIKEDIDDLKKEINAYESQGCKRDQELSACLAMINATGWKYPLKKGCVTSEYTGYAIRTDWSGGGGHHGIDLSCVSEGTKVYSAADGIVKRIIRESKCGGNMVYIYHTVNGKKYTTVYMHLLNISSDIYVNKVVTDQTVIGSVGGGSTAKKKGGYDKCTEGTHLHFGLADGWNATSFNSYSFNPREKIKFPKLIYSGGGYFYR